jgi:hypothetical protein
MRDRQRVEELSLTAALGLWADDVVLALNRVMQGNDVSTDDASLLSEGADVLDDAGQRVKEPLTTPGVGHALAATDPTLKVVTVLMHDRPGDIELAVLARMAIVLRTVSSGDTRQAPKEDLDALVSLFSRVAEAQLRESSSFLTGKESSGWLATL